MTSIAIYKMTSLLVGLGFAYMGYRLFMANIWGNAGDVSGEFNQNKIVFKRAAPGTFFAIAGAIIVVATIFRGFELDRGSSDVDLASSSEGKPSLPALSPLTKE